MAKVTNLSLGTGRRKTSVARVYLRSGNGAIMVNGKSVEAYFANPEHVFTVKQPLVATASEGKFDILINVKGGAGQRVVSPLAHSLHIWVAIEKLRIFGGYFLARSSGFDYFF